MLESKSSTSAILNLLRDEPGTPVTFRLTPKRVLALREEAKVGVLRFADISTPTPTSPSFRR